MRKTRLGPALAVVVMQGALAGEPAQVPPVVPMSDVHISMYQVLEQITQLEPYVVSEKKFLDKANEKEIIMRLDTLEKLFKDVIAKKELKSPTFRLTGQALENHFLNAKALFRMGRKEHARWMLASVPTACGSCHTQLPEAPKPLWGLDESNFQGTDFERAEFLFGTRNYDPALKLYDKLTSTYPGNASSVRLEALELERALQRKLLIYLRIKRDAGAALASFERDLKNPQLPLYVKTYLKSWVSQLRQAAREPVFDFTKASSKETLSYAKRWFGEDTPRLSISPEHPKLIGHLQGMSALYGYLDTHAEDASTPEILYWLGVGELGFNRSFFFSLGNMYLLECMKRFPQSAYAKRCYNEYAEEMKFLYSGSAGTNLPPEVGDALRALHTLVYGSHKANGGGAVKAPR